jgi:predicted DsbA family dithiol-disulfide isomerase
MHGGTWRRLQVGTGDNWHTGYLHQNSVARKKRPSPDDPPQRGALAGTRRQGVSVGKDEGIDFAFDRIEQTANTLDAHRLIWLADKEGVQDAVVEALFRAYFTDGRDIGKGQTLIDVVAESGLDRGKAESVLNGDDGLEAINEAIVQARQLGVEGVPFFIVNGDITLSSAQLPMRFWRRLGRRLVVSRAEIRSSAWIEISRRLLLQDSFPGCFAHGPAEQLVAVIGTQTPAKFIHEFINVLVGWPLSNLS